MKKISISSLAAALALSFAVQSNAQVLTQSLTFDLTGIQDGTTFTNHSVIGTPGAFVRLATKDVIGLLVTNAPSDLKHARLLILSDFTGTNGIPTTVVIRGIKGATNDLDVTDDFTFKTLTNYPSVTTGRVGTNGVDEGHTTYSISRVAVHLGTNAPIIAVRGFQVAHELPAVQWSSHVPVVGVSTSWDLDSASGFGPGSSASVPVYGNVSASPNGVDERDEK